METEEIRWRVPSLFWLPIVICGCLIFAINVFQVQYYTISPIRVQIPDLISEEESLSGFLIKTPGCRIPYMEPFDSSIKKYLEKWEPHVCNKGFPPLVESNFTSIFIVNSSIRFYEKFNSSDAFKCCYRPFIRLEPKENERDQKVSFQNTCREFKQSASITDEFIRVECKHGSSKVYTDFFSFVPIKKNIKRIGYVQKPLNVLVIGIDAVSRLNFHRQMPTTVEYLKNLSAVELLGYNKVADNTYPNLIPVLTGLSETELSRVCWKDNGHFDKCPFLWKGYKKRGFVTSFGEDSAWMGIFNYLKKGFKEQPTDYMWSIFNGVSEHVIGNSHNMNMYECVGAREVYKVFLDHIMRFVVKMDAEKLPYFAFYWGSSLSHDYLNKPSIGDSSYLNFFKKLKEGGHLNNTILVVMSDHGIRWGGIRQTYQGRMEERLPFVFIALPEWYRRQYQDAYNNLLKNTRRLTTPFDLHETMKDFLYSFNLTKEFLETRSSRGRRGYSLFNKISPKRTCEDAAISSHWCTCQQSFEIENNDTGVVESANYAVMYMNTQLMGYGQCAVLNLTKILNARLMTHGDHILNGNEIKNYMITVQTSPGDGVFEVTVKRTENNNAYQYEVMGTISRLNLYGQQSVCITDFHLKLYCYCKSLLPLSSSGTI